MHWWIITVACICCALLIQYLCSSKLLRMKQTISLKTMALRDARDQGAQLDEQAAELKGQQSSLAHSIDRLLKDIERLRNQLQERELEVPEPDFPLVQQPAADSPGS